MEYPEVTLFRDFNIELGIPALIIESSNVISNIFAFVVWFVNLNNAQPNKEKTLRYKLDQSILDIIGHLDLPRFLDKHQSGRLFHLSLISRR